jgi:hypothetical protein
VGGGGKQHCVGDDVGGFGAFKVFDAHEELEEGLDDIPGVT